jgi:hypothetical protein
MKPLNGMQFLSGGYLIACPVPRAPSMDASLTPSAFRTASGCLAPLLPDTWALDWVKSTEEEWLPITTRFGIPPDRLKALIQWVSHRFDGDFLWPNVLLTLEAAQEFCATFLPAEGDAFILGLGLASTDTDDFLHQTAPFPGQTAIGLHQSLARRLPPSKGGTPLGSEVLGLEDGGSLHSFRCNGLERAFSQHWGAQPNGYGLFDDHALAQRCAAYARSEAAQAEPIPWQAWALIEYPRAVGRPP